MQGYWCCRCLLRRRSCGCLGFREPALGDHAVGEKTAVPHLLRGGELGRCCGVEIVALTLDVIHALDFRQRLPARDFVASKRPGEVVRKAFRNIAEAPRETSVVTEADLTRIQTVRFAPVIFQRFVPADLDLRVTFVEDEFFAAAIRSGLEHQADYRLGVGHAEVFPYELPDEVTVKLRRLMDELDLRFGGIDLRVTPQGEHVFLEVNPAGEYLFVTERTGQPVPQAIAAALERHDREWVG